MEDRRGCCSPPTCVSRWMDGSPERRGPAERGRVEKSTSRANAGEMGRPVLPSPPMYLQPHDAELPTLSCHSTCTSRTSCPMLCPLLSVLRTSACPANSTYAQWLILEMMLVSGHADNRHWIIPQMMASRIQHKGSRSRSPTSPR